MLYATWYEYIEPCTSSLTSCIFSMKCIVRSTPTVNRSSHQHLRIQYSASQIRAAGWTTVGCRRALRKGATHSHQSLRRLLRHDLPCFALHEDLERNPERVDALTLLSFCGRLLVLQADGGLCLRTEKDMTHFLNLYVFGLFKVHRGDCDVCQTS